MFEVNLFTPAQFGAFIPWLAINRGRKSEHRTSPDLLVSKKKQLIKAALSVLIHPNTENEGEAERNHTQRAIWMGVSLFPSG